jgi:tripartite-type tricarboxylate transporter receptor subunit TctC
MTRIPACVMPSRRRLVAAAALAPLAAIATAWPSRPVRLLVAYPPGGVSDETARALGQGLAQALHVPCIVENRGGAGGVTAMTELAQAKPDGHTLCYSAISPLVFAPLLGPLRFDPLHDFVPVVSVMHTPILVLSNPSFKPDTMAEMVARALGAPGNVRWASSGIATVGHMVIEQVRLASGADVIHVPYKGGGQQLNDLLGGHFEMLSSNMAPQQLEYVRQGRLKALAVGAPARMAALPQVPTLAEAGFPQANLVSTFGIFAPGRTPPDVVARLNREFNRLLLGRELRQRLTEAGNLMVGGTSEDFARHIVLAQEASARLLSRLVDAVATRPGR